MDIILKEYHPLWKAYVDTTYAVDVYGIHIRIGQGHAQLDELLLVHHVDSWAFITAFNPRSSVLRIDENEKRHQALHVQLKSYTCLEGISVSDDGDWPPEKSWLVLGIDPAEAIRIGQHWEQNAIVIGRLGQPAELLWIQAQDE